MKTILNNRNALLFSLVIAVIAYFLGQALPLVGGPAFGILLGLAVGNSLKPQVINHASFRDSSKLLLAMSLSLLGFGLNLNQVLAVGSDSLLVMGFTLVAAFATAFFIGRYLKISYHMTSLIGMGTAICGGSAIAALAPVIKAPEDDISYAISTIFIYNLAAVFIFPFVAHLIGLTNEGFGLWAGTAINDTSSVLAAAYAFGPEAGDYAAVVKLTRTTLIVPMCLIFALITIKKEKKDQPVNFGLIAKAFPKFILYFLIASAITTSNILPQSVTLNLSFAAKTMIIWALAAVGLGSNFRKMVQNGFRPFLLGLCVWFAVSVTALGVQYFTGRW